MANTFKLLTKDAEEQMKLDEGMPENLIVKSTFTDKGHKNMLPQFKVLESISEILAYVDAKNEIDYGIQNETLALKAYGQNYIQEGQQHTVEELLEVRALNSDTAVIEEKLEALQGNEKQAFLEALWEESSPVQTKDMKIMVLKQAIEDQRNKNIALYKNIPTASHEDPQNEKAQPILKAWREGGEKLKAMLEQLKALETNTENKEEISQKRISPRQPIRASTNQEKIIPQQAQKDVRREHKVKEER